MDFHRYFRVSPLTVHRMLLTLDRDGHIRRIPGMGRSIALLVPPEQLPILREPVNTPVSGL
jgi:repressor LexA